MKHQTCQALFIGFASMVFAIPSAAQAQDSKPDSSAICGPLIYGDWVTTDGISQVKIHDCQDDKICGKISHLSDPALLDGNNTDSNLRDRQLLGANLLSGFSAAKKNKYKGKIYNPEDGKTYESNIKINEDSRLKVKGCLGPFCQTQYWDRPESCFS